MPKKELPIQTEYEAQRDIFAWAEHMEHKYPELWFLNGSLNGVRLTIGQAVKAKKAGMKKGYPDIFLPVARMKWHGLYIELKREKNSRATPEQNNWLFKLSEQGYLPCICKGKEAAIRVIIQYLDGNL